MKASGHIHPKHFETISLQGFIENSLRDLLVLKALCTSWVSNYFAIRE